MGELVRVLSQPVLLANALLACLMAFTAGVALALAVALPGRPQAAAPPQEADPEDGWKGAGRPPEYDPGRE